MSRTLTRPMFRKGGMAQRTNYMGGGIKTVRPRYMGGGMTGIMSGIQPDAGLTPRTSYSTGKTFKQIQKENRIKQEIQNKLPFLTPPQIEAEYNKYIEGLEDTTGMLMGIEEDGPGTFLENQQTDLATARSEEGKKAFITDLTAKEEAKEKELIQKGIIESDKSVFKDTSEIPDRERGEPGKSKKTITQKLEDTPSDQDTIKSYMDMFQEALGTDEDDITRDKYLQLAKFGANLLAQPGGDLVGAVGRAAAPSIEGLAKTQASAKAADREVKLAAIKTAIDKMDDPTLDKIKSIAKAANLPIEEVAKSFVETAQEGKTKESIITTNRDGMKGEIGEGPALKAARTMAEAGLNFALFNLLPVNKDGSVKEDTPNGYYYDEKGELSVIKDGVQSAIKIKAKE